jgi:hypothetical protein
MGRISRLEKRIDQLEDALANLTFQSDADVQQVEVPVPALDANGVATGGLATGYRQIKLGPTSGKIQFNKNGRAVLVVK